MSCKTCPFAFTDESEKVQNYGCLPTPYEIIQMKRETGHNWSCHYNDDKVCQGFVSHVKDSQKNNWLDNMNDIDTTTGNIISYTTWELKGQEEAIREANDGTQNQKNN